MATKKAAPQAEEPVAAQEAPEVAEASAEAKAPSKTDWVNIYAAPSCVVPSQADEKNVFLKLGTANKSGDVRFMCVQVPAKDVRVDEKKNQAVITLPKDAPFTLYNKPDGTPSAHRISGGSLKAANDKYRAVEQERRGARVADAEKSVPEAEASADEVQLGS